MPSQAVVLCCSLLICSVNLALLSDHSPSNNVTETEINVESTSSYSNDITSDFPTEFYTEAEINSETVRSSYFDNKETWTSSKFYTYSTDLFGTENVQQSSSDVSTTGTDSELYTITTESVDSEIGSQTDLDPISRRTGSTFNIAIAETVTESTGTDVYFSTPSTTENIDVDICPNEPGRVEDLNVQDYSYSLNVTWSPPLENNSCIETYYIYWNRTDVGDTDSFNVTANDTYYLIEGLSACKEYKVTVVAVDTENKSSEATSQTVRTSAEVPGKVENLDLQEYPHFLNVTWSQPRINNTCIESYYIKYIRTEDNYTKNFTVPGDSNYFLLVDLIACMEYEVTVSAMNKYNQSSEPSSQNKNTGAQAIVPKYNATIKTETNKAVIQWILQDISSNRCILSCIVVCNVTDDPPQRPGLTDGSGTLYSPKEPEIDVVVTGLSPFTNYVCVAYTTSIADSSGMSEEIMLKTEQDVPPAPEILYVIPGSYSFDINWKIENVPGILTGFNITVTYIDSDYNLYCGDEPSASFRAESQEQSYVMDVTRPSSSYNISVSASTQAGEGDYSEPQLHHTLPGVPDSVRDLKYQYNLDDIHSTVIYLEWHLPCNANGKLKGFNINYNGIYNTSVDEGSVDWENGTWDETCCEYSLSDLKPDYNYKIFVSALVEDVNERNESQISLVYPAGVPKISESAQGSIWADPSATSDPTSQAFISFPRDVFLNNSGIVRWYQMIVAQENYLDQSDGRRYNGTGDIPRMSTWNDAVVNGIICPYQATPADWNPFMNVDYRESQSGTFTLGKDDCSNVADGQFCNGPLRPDTRYSVKIRGFTTGGYQDTVIITFTTDSEVAVGMIVGIIVAVIAVGLLAILFIMYRRGTLVWPPQLFVRKKETTVRPQPVLLKKFPAYCAQLLDNPTRLSSEYQLLATLSADVVAANSYANGLMPENKRKNRYINILPYDSTRVPLDIIDGDPTSHYINASFIKGYSNDIEYIATQGPKEETCLDFWRMVYQHDVRVIVMVTNLVEQDKPKCHQYYPNLRDNLVFGDMTIRCTTEMCFPIHTARTLVLVKGDRKRTLSHLHFREWPDFGVPHSTDLMLQFCQTMRHHAYAAEFGLILVHCSAGVGRTGTLIAVDILLQHISENKKVDIFGTVFKLRKQRVNMVQTEGQYTYIYRCIKDAVEDPTIVNHGTTSNNSLEPIYENVGTSLNTLQYEKLPKVSDKSSSSESECELLELTSAEK